MLSLSQVNDRLWEKYEKQGNPACDCCAFYGEVKAGSGRKQCLADNGGPVHCVVKIQETCRRPQPYEMWPKTENEDWRWYSRRYR